MSKRKGLGRGLDSLIPGEDILPQTDGANLIQISSIVPNPRQPRMNLDASELDELTASIREHGILQPLIVTPANEDGLFTLIAGERRLQAAAQAGLASVPVIVREATDQQRLELALIENLQRENLTPLEEADAYRQLKEDFELSHEEIAQRVGKNRVTVTNTLRLLRLSTPVKKMLMEDRITEGHARALLGLQTHEAQTAALKTVLAQELSVRQTEALVRRISGEKEKSPKDDQVSPEVRDFEDRLQGILGTRVSLKTGKRGGRLTIYYYSDEELEAIVNRLMNT